ncbi:g9850 [Coccomyxa elongata]
MYDDHNHPGMTAICYCPSGHDSHVDAPPSRDDAVIAASSGVFNYWNCVGTPRGTLGNVVYAPMGTEIPHAVLADQGETRLRLLRAILRRRTLEELVKSHPRLALALYAARAQLVLQGKTLATPPPEHETSVTSDSPDTALHQAGAGCLAQGWDAAVRAACQPPKPPSQAAQLEDTMLHQLGVLELLVQQSALLLRLTAHVAAAAAAAPVQQRVMAWPRQDSNSSQAADTACLADDAASECRCSSRSKRAHPGATSDDCEALSPPSWKRACLGSGPQPGVAGRGKPARAKSDDSSGSIDAFKALAAEVSCEEMGESEPSNNSDSDMDDAASSSACSGE